MFAELPAFAAWRFVGAVHGFEVLFAEQGRLRGHTSAVEDGRAYAVRYEIELDEQWRTRRAAVTSDTVSGPRAIELVSDGQGRWMLDGVRAPELDGLLDVDLEASACTNLLPVRRVSMPAGEVTPAPAAYIQALDLTVRRLDQTYCRLDAHRFDYAAEPGFSAVLEYDRSGLVVDYPGIASRFA